jgi:hypothetical protein
LKTTKCFGDILKKDFLVTYGFFVYFIFLSFEQIVRQDIWYPASPDIRPDIWYPAFRLANSIFGASLMKVKSNFKNLTPTLLLYIPVLTYLYTYSTVYAYLSNADPVPDNTAVMLLI